MPRPLGPAVNYAYAALGFAGACLLGAAACVWKALEILTHEDDEE